MYLRRVIRALLESQQGFEVCGEAQNGQEAVEMARQLSPDVVVLDISMPILNGFEAAQKIKQSAPHVRILMLSVVSDATHVSMAKAIGVNGYLSKLLAGELLIVAVDAVYRNQLFFPSTTDRMDGDENCFNANRKASR